MPGDLNQPRGFMVVTYRGELGMNSFPTGRRSGQLTNGFCFCLNF